MKISSEIENLATLRNFRRGAPPNSATHEMEDPFATSQEGKIDVVEVLLYVHGGGLAGGDAGCFQGSLDYTPGIREKEREKVGVKS